MLKITKQSITLTKGDDASIQLIPRYKDGTAYTFASGDKGYFRLKVGSTLIEKECDVYADLNKMVISFQPEDTVNLNPGIYRYEVELITIYGFHYTFIADQTFIIGKEYEQRLQSSSGSNGTPGSNLPQVDGELTEDPIVSGEIQPTNPSIDYNNFTNKPKLNGVQIAGEHDNAYYGIPTALSELTDDEGHRTVSDTEKSTWDNKSDFSGSYNDLTDVPSDLVEDTHYVHTDNNYTSTEKTKLGTIAEGAEVNVNADWNASSGDAEILNKPTLGTAAAKDYTSSVLENSTDLVESGAVKTAIDNAISSVYKPSGNKACAELVSGLLIASNLGNVYNMTDDGVTTADFVEGAGKPIEAGDNVVIVDVGSSVYKFDLLSGMVDLSNYVQKSSISGLIKNDGSIDSTAYAKQSEMSVTPGTGTDADKTTIQLKSGTTATVLTQHQDISGKVDKEQGKGLSTNDYTTTEKEKLAAISSEANKVTASSTNGNIQIDGIETVVYDDLALQTAVSGLEDDVVEIQGELTTDTTIIEGNPLNFNTKSAQTAKSTILSVEPIQDLHGYDKPWVGGAGKNLLPLVLDDIQSAWTDGTWNNNTYTYHGISILFNVDADGNIISIKITGTATETTTFAIDISSALTDNVSYINSGCPSGGGTSTYRSDLRTIDWSVSSDGIDTGSGATFTKSFDIKYWCLRINNAYAFPTEGLMFYPMIRLSTESDATFAPYTNECSISGRTEIGVLGCGKNIVFKDIANSNINGSGVISTSTTYKTNIARVKKDLTYTITTQDSSIVYAFFTSEPDIDSTSYNASRYVGDNATFIAPIDGYVAFRSSKDATQLQLELGNQAMDYEPYTKSNDLTISFGQTVYGGTLDVENGVLVVADKTPLLDLGSLSWIKYADGVFLSNAPEDALKYAENKLPNWKCSCYQVVNTIRANSSISSLPDYCITEQVPSDAKRILVKDARYTDATAFTSAISGQKLCYDLTIPVEISLDAHQISLLKGVNNISTDGDSISLTYRDGSVATLEDVMPKTIKFAGKEYSFGMDSTGLYLENITDGTKAYIQMVT